jgi:CRP-like cAMP-binding protein
MVSEARPFASIEEELQALPLFQEVEAEHLRLVADAAQLAHHEKGDVFLLQGQPLAHFYVVLDGWCGASKVNPDGQESILQIFRSGDFLTQPDCFSSPVALCGQNVMALTSARLLLVPPTIMRAVMAGSKVFTANLLSISMRQMQELRDHVEQLTLSSAERRVGRFLLQIKFSARGDRKELVLPFDKAQIAAYLGIKPETFSRTLQLLKERGFVIKRNRLQVPNRDALCSYCDVHAARSCCLGQTTSCPFFIPSDASQS